MKWPAGLFAAGLLATGIHHGRAIALIAVGVLAVVAVGTLSGRATRHPLERGNRRAHAAVHEAGHYVVAKRRGSTGATAWLTADGGGWTRTSKDRSGRDQAVISAAGTAATNLIEGRSESTTSGDAKILRQICLTQDARNYALREARKEVRTHRAEIERVAEKLYRNGRV